MKSLTKKKAATPKAAAAKKTESSAARAGSASAFHGVLLRPHVSEKAVSMESRGTYTFIVASSATKITVREAVYRAYGVRPTDVRILRTMGKTVRAGRGYGRRSDVKKAVVTLPKGQTISIHAGV